MTTRPILLQLLSFEGRRTTFLTCIKLSSLWERDGRAPEWLIQGIFLFNITWLFCTPFPPKIYKQQTERKSIDIWLFNATHSIFSDGKVIWYFRVKNLFFLIQIQQKQRTVSFISPWGKIFPKRFTIETLFLPERSKNKANQCVRFYRWNHFAITYVAICRLTGAIDWHSN